MVYVVTSGLKSLIKQRDTFTFIPSRKYFPTKEFFVYPDAVCALQFEYHRSKRTFMFFVISKANTKRNRKQEMFI
jgi:hypothetical protein